MHNCNYYITCMRMCSDVVRGFNFLGLALFWGGSITVKLMHVCTHKTTGANGRTKAYKVGMLGRMRLILCLMHVHLLRSGSDCLICVYFMFHSCSHKIAEYLLFLYLSLSLSRAISPSLVSLCDIFPFLSLHINFAPISTTQLCFCAHNFSLSLPLFLAKSQNPFLACALFLSHARTISHSLSLFRSPFARLSSLYTCACFTISYLSLYLNCVCARTISLSLSPPSLSC